MNYERLRNLVQADPGSGFQRVSGGFLMRCPCPGHGTDGYDENPSLLVGNNHGKASVKCLAGCDEVEIVQELLRKYPELSEGEEKGRHCTLSDLLPLSLIERARELVSETPQGLKIPLFSPTGEVFFLYRSKPTGPNKNRLTKGSPASKLLFTVPESWASDKREVFVTESPMDSLVLGLLGFQAVAGVGKLNTPKALKAWLEAGKLNLPSDARVIVWCEPDAPEFPQEVARALGRKVEVIDPPSSEIKDALRLIQNWGPEKTKEWILKKLSLTLPVVNPSDPKIGVITVAELKEIIGTQPFVVEGIIPQGLILVGGRPRAGKTTFALSFIRAVFQGEEFLGHPIKPGLKPLYLLYEKKQSFVTKASDLGLSNLRVVLGRQEGITISRLEKLEELVRATGANLLVLDPLVLFLDRKDKQTLSDYGIMYDCLSLLKDFCERLGVTVFALHHLRKLGEGGETDILGSTSLSAVVDATITLKKKAESVEASIEGNLLEDTKLNLVFEEGKGLVLAKEEVTALQKACTLIMSQLSNNPEGLPFSELREGLRGSFPEKGEEALKKLLLRGINRLIQEGKIEKRGRIYVPVSPRTFSPLTEETFKRGHNLGTCPKDDVPKSLPPQETGDIRQNYVPSGCPFLETRNDEVLRHFGDLGTFFSTTLEVIPSSTMEEPLKESSALSGAPSAMPAEEVHPGWLALVNMLKERG